MPRNVLAQIQPSCSRSPAHRTTQESQPSSSLCHPFPSGTSQWTVQQRFVFIIDFELPTLWSYLGAVHKFVSPSVKYRRAAVYAGTSANFLAIHPTIRSSGLILQRIRSGDQYPDEFRRAMEVLETQPESSFIHRILVYNQNEHNSHYRNLLGKVSPYYLSPALSQRDILSFLEADCTI